MANRNQAEKVLDIPAAEVVTTTPTVVETPPAVETPTQGNVAAVTTKQESPVYLLDWNSGLTPRAAYQLGGHTKGEIIADRERWLKDNGKSGNWFEYMDMVPETHDVHKTKEQNEADIKKAERQEKWEKIGNFLSHLGNFIGAAGFGAPSQTLESSRELTARQQAIRDKTEALRTAYNNRLYENYWKQRAEENNQAKTKLAQQQQDLREANYYLAVHKQDWKEKMDKDAFDLKKLEYDLKKEVAEGKMSQGEKVLILREATLALQQQKERRIAGGTETKTEVTKETPFGKETTKTTRTTTPAGAQPKPIRKKTPKKAFR